MRVVITCLLIWLMTVSPAVAWNAAGHRIIASIAFRQLSAAQQQQVVTLLARHPRFSADFADQMPAEIRRGDETMQSEWLFQQAAIWPDTVRGGPPEKRAFNRSGWHYVNLPHFLSDDQRAALQDTLPALQALNREMVPPQGAALDTAALNVAQVIGFGKRELADKQSSPEARAVLLSWLFHNVGDIHQPLHSTALFSQRLFPDGDRGGNSIKTRQAGNLHSLWDQFPGQDDSFTAARNRAIAYVNEAGFSKLGQDAAGALNEHAWVIESHALAKAAVYDEDVLAALRRMEAGGGTIEEITLSEAYLRAGGRLAETRWIQAGYRLAAVLKQVSP